MSVQIALNRALFRHLSNIASLAAEHYVRSGRPGYYRRYQNLRDHMNRVYLTCNFPVQS